MKRYGVIIADPPWEYQQWSERKQGAARAIYETMNLETICALPIRELAAPDCILLLWATWPKMTEAMRVIPAWGFEYITGFPWVKIEGFPMTNLWGDLQLKPQYGIGFWVRCCSEPVLIARRGQVSPPDGGALGLLSENFGHSRKPDNLYDFAERLPGPYLELFARRARPGWDVWGNEVKCSIDFAGEVST